MSKKLVRYKNVNGVLVKQFESPALVNGLVDIGQLPVVGSMGAAIIECGSNANGSYIKWADGTMFCTNTYAGEPYYADYLFCTNKWVLPIATVGRPYKFVVGVSAINNNNQTNNNVYTSIGYQEGETYVWSTGTNSGAHTLAQAIRTGGSYSVVSYTAYLVAIGRWK